MEKRNLTTADIRRRLNLTQREFSDKFGVPLRTVENWEHRQNCPAYFLAAVERIVQLEDMLEPKLPI